MSIDNLNELQEFTHFRSYKRPTINSVIYCQITILPHQLLHKLNALLKRIIGKIVNKAIKIHLCAILFASIDNKAVNKHICFQQ